MFNYGKAELIVLPSMLVGIVIVAIVLGLLLKNKSEKVKNIPFILITVSLIVMEIIKQVKRFEAGYDYWSIPLHYCSMFMLWFSLATFGKGKVKRFGRSISFSSLILFWVAFYVSPISIIGHSSANVFGSFSNFHTFAYHHLMTLFGLLLITLKLNKPSFKHNWFIGIAYTIFFAVSVVASVKLDTNFTSLLESVIPFFNTIIDQVGYWLYWLIMFVIGAGGNLLANTVNTLIYNKVKKNKS